MVEKAQTFRRAKSRFLKKVPSKKNIHVSCKSNENILNDSEQKKEETSIQSDLVKYSKYNSVTRQKSKSITLEKSFDMVEIIPLKLNNCEYNEKEDEKLQKIDSDLTSNDEKAEFYTILHDNEGFEGNFSIYFRDEIDLDLDYNIEYFEKLSSLKIYKAQPVNINPSYNTSRIMELMETCQGWIQKALLKPDKIIEKNFWSELGYLDVCHRLQESNEFFEDMLIVFDKRNRMEEQYAKEMLEWTNVLSESVAKYIYPNTDYFLYGDIHTIFQSFVNMEIFKAKEHTKLWKNIDVDISQMLSYFYNTQKLNLNGKKTKDPRDLEINFEMVRKDWTKLENKLIKSKRVYDEASNEFKKLQERKKQIYRKEKLSPAESKRKYDMKNALDKYTRSIKKMKNQQGAFKEKMTNICSKYTDFEMERLKIFKFALEKYYKSSNFNENKSFSELNEKVMEAIARFNPAKTMEAWSESYGARQPFEPINIEENIKENLFGNASTKNKPSN